MLYLHSWLADHLETLPEPEELATLLTMRAFEVEEWKRLPDGDALYDLKVLPNRAHDALSHRGMAREIAALTDGVRRPLLLPDIVPDKEGKEVAIVVDDPRRTPRYIGVRVEGVSGSAMAPQQIQARLSAVGARPISALVDITNTVLFDLGQPMHVFDADKVVGAIHARVAISGETMRTLDGKELIMDGSETVIADDEGILALAGVKGGTKAEVTAETKNVIFESATFHPSLTRRSAARHGIRTDAAKRYENGIPLELAEEGMRRALALVREVFPDAVLGAMVDACVPLPRHPFRVGTSKEEIAGILGLSLGETEIADAFRRLGFASTHIDNPRAEFLRIAQSLLGTPYDRSARLRFDAPEKMNCSVLVAWSAIGAGLSTIPRVCVDQFVYTDPIDPSEARPGDLVFTNSGDVITKEGAHYSRVLDQVIPDAAIRTETLEYMPGTPVPHGVDHVGVLLGDGKVIHSSSRTGGTVCEPLEESASFRGPVWYRRLFRDDTPRILVTIPWDRMDIERPEDLVEEVGRMIGLDRIPSILPDLERRGVPSLSGHWSDRAREILIAHGWSEVMTYGFTTEGDVELVNSVATDRLRTTLVPGLEDALARGKYNAPTLGLRDILLFEIGSIFRTDGERLALSFGAVAESKKGWKVLEEELRSVRDDLARLLGVPSEAFLRTDGELRAIFSIDLGEAIRVLPPAFAFEPLPRPSKDLRFQSLSAFPFIVRDIAVWVTTEEDAAMLAAIIETEGGKDRLRHDLFDSFTKTDEQGVTRTSLAYRIVFQSMTRTLTDEDIAPIMDRLTAALVARGWEVR